MCTQNVLYVCIPAEKIFNYTSIKVFIVHKKGGMQKAACCLFCLSCCHYYFELSAENLLYQKMINFQGYVCSLDVTLLIWSAVRLFICLFTRIPAYIKCSQHLGISNLLHYTDVKLVIKTFFFSKKTHTYNKNNVNEYRWTFGVICIWYDDRYAELEKFWYTQWWVYINNIVLWFFPWRSDTSACWHVGGKCTKLLQCLILLIVLNMWSIFWN